ncbi:MAG: alpha-2-macroglobulin family protein [Bacteroidales bacterium]|nr:alpha-2-macroglobulin family protein [Bacteroidales bacterium]
MKHLLSFIIFALMSIFSTNANAQSYTQLWNDATRAFNDDLPKSALATLHQIRDKAAAEDNQPQLLRALCTEFTVAHEVSRDSDSISIKRIEEAWAVEKRPVERALWQYALGRIRHDKVLILGALSNTEVLASAKASDYVPAFALGRDSRCFNDDLLSVLTFDALDNYFGTFQERRDLLAKMRAHYESHGNTLAVLVCDYMDWNKFSLNTYNYAEIIARLKEAMPALKKLDKRSGGNLAKVLQWAIDENERPTIRVSVVGSNNDFHPGEPLKFVVSSNNIAHAELRIYRALDLTNETFDTELDVDKYAKKKKRCALVTSVEKDLEHTPANKIFKDTLTTRLDEAGIYIAELLVEGKVQDRRWLHISGLKPVFFSTKSAEGEHVRMTIVDSRTGHPFTEGVSAKHREAERYRGNFNHRPWLNIEPEADGTFDVTNIKLNDEIAISVGSDVYRPVFNRTPFYGGYYDSNMNNNNARIYTDRAIYRPGQKVQVGGFVYSRHNDDYEAIEGMKGKLVLQDKDYEDIAEISVSTDEFGQFSGEFTLPEHVVPGLFPIVFRGAATAETQYVRVEEYKRPTFRVTLNAADSRELVGKPSWEAGDTLVLNGLVETFAGVPVPNTEVTWETTFQPWFLFRWYSSDRFQEFEDDDLWRMDGDEDPKCGGTITTDDEGRFSISITLKKEGFYQTKVDVTASNGETATASHALQVGTRTERPAEPEATEKKPELFTKTTNEAGDESTLTIDLRALDEGTDLPVTLFYDVVSSKGGIVKHEVILLNDPDFTLNLKWQEKYGDGATGFVCFVKNNRLYDQAFQVEKPKPDKRLMMEWSTFRNHLQPGEQETWSLRVKHPDGTPANASIMARLYDASLDAFASRPWQFDLVFDRSLPTCYATTCAISNSGFYYEKALKNPSKDPKFSEWEPSMFDYYGIMELASLSLDGGTRRLAKSNSTMYLAEAMPMAAPSREPGVKYEEARCYEVVQTDAMADGFANEVDDEALAAANSVKARENFDETAFFMPCLRTDSTGHVTLNFTLPESLTQWNFTALAHDRNMNYGMLNDTIFAQKKLTTEIAAPRFLREGDKTDLPVTVRSLSDATLKGELIFVVTDAKTGKPLKTEKRAFELTGKNEAQTFTFPITATCDINVRAVAKTTEFSDGEERNIPFIDGRETIQVSVPFSTTEKGTVKVDLSRLNLPRLMKQDAKCKPQLSVEYSANPIWNVIRVVPTLLEGEAYSATDWATRLYAIEVGDFLSKKLHNTASGALVDSLLSAKDIPALRYSALDHLKDFQRGDGGFSWFRDFYSSPWITADVCVLLARQQKMTGSRTAATMLDKGVKFLEQTAAETVKHMKKEKASGISEVMLRYLYVRQLLGLAPDKDAKYLMELAAKEKKDLTMYGKSAVAQILAKSHPEESLLAMQSLVEFTVATEEMGRYFDTERAFGGWASYKIPTQTMAIEALSAIATERPDATFSPEADGHTFTPAEIQTAMKLWLLQSKRTQKWESSRASADATYALLHGDCNPNATSQLFQTLAPEGYSKRELSADENARAIRSNSFNIIKDTDGLSWGAVYADYTLPIEQVEASSAGFTISRQWEVLRDGKWQPIELPAASNLAANANAKATSANAKAGSSKNAVKVGERVRQTITIRAERDYDFVCVESSRAACMEPRQPLSGLCWMGGTSCYRMVHDSSNEYYFEHLAKGTHTLTEELVIDRSGTFQTGLARVQCTFAPEFGGYAPSATVFAICK